MIELATLGPRMTIRPSASSSDGNAISTSTMRIRTWPSRGNSAESTPIGTPVAIANEHDAGADQESHARRVDGTRQRIAAELIGAEPMHGVRRRQTGDRIDRVGVVWREQRSKDRGKHDRKKNAEIHQRDRARHERRKQQCECRCDSLELHPRIEQAIGQIDDQIDHEIEHDDDQDDALDHGIVPAQDRLDHETADAGQGKHCFGHDRFGQ